MPMRRDVILNDLTNLLYVSPFTSKSVNPWLSYHRHILLNSTACQSFAPSQPPFLPLQCRPKPKLLSPQSYTSTTTPRTDLGQEFYGYILITSARRKSWDQSCCRCQGNKDLNKLACTSRPRRTLFEDCIYCHLRSILLTGISDRPSLLPFPFLQKPCKKASTTNATPASAIDAMMRFRSTYKLKETR
jgi:hypothetical protein